MRENTAAGVKVNQKKKRKINEKARARTHNVLERANVDATIIHFFLFYLFLALSCACVVCNIWSLTRAWMREWLTRKPIQTAKRNFICVSFLNRLLPLNFCVCLDAVHEALSASQASSSLKATLLHLNSSHFSLLLLLFKSLFQLRVHFFLVHVSLICSSLLLSCWSFCLFCSSIIF